MEKRKKSTMQLFISDPVSDQWRGGVYPECDCEIEKEKGGKKLQRWYDFSHGIPK